MTSAGSEQSLAPGPLREHLFSASMGPPGLCVRGCARHSYGCSALTALREFECMGGVRRGQKQVMLQEEQYLSPGRSPDMAEGLGMLRSTQRPLPLSAPAGHPAPGHGAPQTNMDSGERKAPVNSY